MLNRIGPRLYARCSRPTVIIEPDDRLGRQQMLYAAERRAKKVRDVKIKPQETQGSRQVYGASLPSVSFDRHDRQDHRPFPKFVFCVVIIPIGTDTGISDRIVYRKAFECVEGEDNLVLMERLYPEGEFERHRPAITAHLGDVARDRQRLLKPGIDNREICFGSKA